MAIGNFIRFDVPLLIEEKIKMKFITDDLFLKKYDQVSKLNAQLGILPTAIKICIRLQNMEMRVHRFFFVGIFFAKAQISKQIPVAIECFQIAIGLRIEAVLFNQLKQFARTA